MAGSAAWGPDRAGGEATAVAEVPGVSTVEEAFTVAENGEGRQSSGRERGEGGEGGAGALETGPDADKNSPYQSEGAAADSNVAM